ncbi:MAG: hypothetical protein HRU21_13440 [Pseudomonadales bacterium]|nr:hypothetical protein [Pseudomonadales bacterium]
MSSPENKPIVYQAEITGYAFHDYAVYLHQGDTLRLSCNNASLDIVLTAPIEKSLVSGEDFIAPQSAHYNIRVLQARALARQQKQQSYRLSLMINPD